jgi:hypothetical protein
MKCLISYSLWGNLKAYCCGAIQNAKLARDLFPGWTCRFYTAKNVPARVVADLEALGAEIVQRPVPMGYVGLFWRFGPAYDDPGVERFIVRDTDSRLTPRDAGMVEEWVESGEPAHIIRDCESHGAWMLGATWGLMPGYIPEFNELISEFWQDYHGNDPNIEHGFESQRGRFYGVDQEFLSRKVWPIIKDHHLAHDSHFHFTGKERPYKVPLTRKPPDLSYEVEPYVGMICNLEPEYEKYEYS